MSSKDLCVELSWNARGLLNRIKLLEVTSPFQGEGSEIGLREKLREELNDALQIRLDATGEWTRLPLSILRLRYDLQALFVEGKAIEQIPWDLLDFGSCTEFQRKVYRATGDIPSGETRTYGWVAKRMGMPQAARAVGQALGANPFPLLIPCHRVIKTDGEIGGYLGGSTKAAKSAERQKKALRTLNEAVMPIYLKQFLLNREHAYRNPLFGFVEDFLKASVLVSHERTAG